MYYYSNISYKWEFGKIDVRFRGRKRFLNVKYYVYFSRVCEVLKYIRLFICIN